MYTKWHKQNLSLLAIYFLCVYGSVYAQSISISNIVDLQKIGNDPNYPLNGNYVLTRDIDANETINWNSGAGFKPIGDYNNPFTGSFDGQNYGIYNLYINRQSEYAGLFGTVSGGTVHNVILFGCNIAGFLYAGGLVGLNMGGEIRECAVSSSGIEGFGDINDSVGGLVGGNSGLIERCVVSNSTIYDVYSQYGVGGLVGYNLGGVISNSCVYSSAYITSVTGAYGVGGLVGIFENSEKSTGIVTNCYSSAAVVGTMYTGGLIGFNNGGTVTSSYWDTSVSGMFFSDGGIGKTTVQMKQQVTYTGWDFTNVWSIEEGTDYPYLRWVINIQHPVEVPSLLGMTEANAVSILNGLGLVVDVFYDCNDIYPAGIVMDQYPGAGSSVEANSTVTIIVSTGLCLIPVPNVEGMNETDAINLLRSSGFTGEITTRYDCNDLVPAGTVISQDPMPGSTEMPEANIYLYISRGPCSITLPDVVGMNETTAVNTIQSLNLLANVLYRCDDTIPEGIVIEQEPFAGNVVQIDNTVYIVVSTGPCVYVTLPNVIGMTEANAVTTLEGMGFHVIVDYDCSEGIYPAGTVMGQSPEGGAQVIQNSEVYLTVSAGPCPTIEIDSIEELQKIGNDPNYPLFGRYILTQDIYADHTANWNNGKGFKPIGSWEKPFRGTFNGQNHIIFGLFIDNSEADYTGLFGIVTSPGKIQNLILAECVIIGYYFVGAIAGVVVDSECEIVECGVATCYISGVSEDDSIGGFVGGNKGKLLRCFAGDMFVYGETADYGVGGLIGLNYGGNITDSCVYGSFVGGNSFIGGLVGYQMNVEKSFDTNIQNCYSSANIAGKLYVGGLVGYNEGGTVVSSYWDVQSSGTSFSDGGIGKNTLEMYRQATYIGWDFENTWVANEGTDYPFLKWLVDLSGEGEGSDEGEVLVTIPSVVGMTEQQAINAMENAGLNKVRTTYSCNNTVTQGNVLAQTPPAGEVISSQAYVRLTVSSGLCPGVLVPDVVGRSEQQAKDVIQTADLNVKVERECNNYVTVGQVIRQSPIAYSGVNRGSEVTIWVSTGQCSGTTYITVPNVIGQNATSAIGQIQSAGLSARTVMQYSDTVPQNVVMGQSPVGGSSVLNGTTIELIISNGPDPAGAKIETPRGLQTFSGIDHVYLVWEPNVERNLAGYRLERSETRNGPWTAVSANIITSTNYTDNTVDTSRAWFYRLIAIGTNGQQSDPTEPVKAEPGKLRVWIPIIDWLPEGTGDTIQVPININSARGLEPYTIDINVSYNHTILELVEVQKTVVTRNLEVVSDTRTQGVIKFHAGPRVDNEKKVLYGEGHLFDMVFRVRQNTAAGTCVQNTNLTLQRVLIKDTNQKELPVELVHGQLNVLEENPNNDCINSRCIYGDMDTDGYIGMSDTIVFLRKIVRRAGIVDLECDKQRGDFNGDGILDCADVSLLLRKLAGLPINPSSTPIGGKALLEVQNNRTVEIVLDNQTPDLNNEYRMGIELSSLLGIAGMDLVLTYDEGISFSGLSLPTVASNFKKDTEVGEGYLKISISSEKPITKNETGRILQIQFKPTTMTTKKINIQIREVKIKGEFGDDLSWYGEINTKGASITIIGAEQFLNDLKTKFDLVDTNKDGKISYEEAVAQYPTLTRDTFDSADTNKDGYIDKTEAGVVVNEGTLEGTQEGSQEGTSEGSIEGTQEGEGQNQNEGCGCNRKSTGGDIWLKYLLDFILVGMLMLAMGGMQRRRSKL